MLKGFVTDTVKKITLEMIYNIVDERTQEIYERIDNLREKQESDFRYLISKIDTSIGQLRTEMSQIREEVKGEINSLRTEMNSLREEVKGEIRSLNQRIDTIMAMLMSINDKLNKK